MYQNFFNLWQPREFLLTAVKMAQREYERYFGGITFLLVRLLNEPDSLTQGLARTSCLPNLDSRKGDGLIFFNERKVAEPIQSQMSMLKTHTTGIGTEEMVVPQSMISEPHYVVPIEKRADADNYQDMVTVGRARTNDIVLRHPSVSKLHAMFIFDQVGTIGLKDADSKNKTWINGERITQRVEVESGDSIRIGSVETVLCNAVTLRNTLDLVVAHTH